MNADKWILLLTLGVPIILASYWCLRQSYFSKTQIIVRALIVTPIATIAEGILCWALIKYHEYSICGGWSCADKFDGPGPAGYLMMQGFMLMVCTAIVLVGSLSVGIIVGAVKYFLFTKHALRNGGNHEYIP